jgi:serine/threonine-protein kinase
MPPAPESIGRYEIVAELGRGGMGTVYKAHDPVLDRTVALKVLASELLAEPGMRERFLREARSAARLQHPNVVTVYEFGEVDGVPFIAMELLAVTTSPPRSTAAGSDLDSRLAVMVQLCDGLAYAHRSGVVHRDVKPSNVYLLPDRSVKIVDFGIARLEGGTMTTRTGEVLGTPSYMAPEQFSGAPVDHRVDQAAGVMPYELVAGRRPFDAGTVSARSIRSSTRRPAGRCRSRRIVGAAESWGGRWPGPDQRFLTWRRWPRPARAADPTPAPAASKVG